MSTKSHNLRTGCNCAPTRTSPYSAPYWQPPRRSPAPPASAHTTQPITLVSRCLVPSSIEVLANSQHHLTVAKDLQASNLNCPHTLCAFSFLPSTGFNISISLLLIVMVRLRLEWHTPPKQLSFSANLILCMPPPEAYTITPLPSGESMPLQLPLAHHIVRRPVNMYRPTSQPNWPHQCDVMKYLGNTHQCGANSHNSEQFRQRTR